MGLSVVTLNYFFETNKERTMRMSTVMKIVLAGRLCMGLSAVTRVESRKWRHLLICPRPSTQPNLTVAQVNEGPKRLTES